MLPVILKDMHMSCDPLVGPKPVGTMLVSSEKMQVSLRIPISPKSKAKPMATRIPPKRLRGALKYLLLKLAGHLTHFFLSFLF